jgi:hypothetical protein
VKPVSHKPREFTHVSPTSPATCSRKVP